MSSQEVPIPNGPERQRILNVLAQRRYRQRKRERLQSLEKRLDARLGSANTVYPSGRKVQLNHPIQTPLSVPSNPAATIDALYVNCPDFSYGDSRASCNTPQSVPSMSNSISLAELQDLETSQFTFPTEHAIEIPSLQTMEASLRIANLLGLADDFFDLTVTRVLDVSKLQVPIDQLPEHLRPTTAQLLLPHYPAIDVLPWPAVRTKLIGLFSQPDQLRPPVARGPMAMMRLIHAFDDEAEGLRIKVDTPGGEYDENSWEIGQAVFKDWWWVLDDGIVANSNRLRYSRGASKLHL
ncbi:hypothetical protein GLAREA_08081 [Glarea lozoyensis ATCC 20868]|uniref:KaiA N-terminal domain-containing protein n=1 Tax=Glarea lozoyensis (strain ATCC 20868 / MF5171) TaxID=1116229 RepID=S3CWN2_GLAL2|nr:uncharacterized protein GLAREA_08081 [Glarea lozoyensis ATCC 20868]EPE24231.1 hypothetical protein GLAREA_08081 [Glarea lozoyensis ATCC 20868]